MPYTTHGWWYGPGEPTQPGPPLIAKCGGTAICRACREQAGLEPLPVHAPTTPTEQRPARTSPAAELRKAAAKLRAELPAEIAMTPRIVFGDEVDAGGGQFLTALAFMSLSPTRRRVYASLLSRLAAAIRAEIAAEIEAAGKKIGREPHCTMHGLWKQWEHATKIARGEP